MCMEKETLAQRKARRTVESEDFIIKWNCCIDKYGDIFVKAFYDNHRAKIQVLNIIESIGYKSEIIVAYKLDMLISYCESNDDYLMYYLLLALYYEKCQFIYESIYLYESLLMYGYSHSFIDERLKLLYK